MSQGLQLSRLHDNTLTAAELLYIAERERELLVIPYNSVI